MEELNLFKNVLKEEASALIQASERIQAVQIKTLNEIFGHLIAGNGRLFFCGVGKSGFIARKLASTFSSLGRPSIFIHPTEALHGDLGLVSENDAMVFLSKSGTTEEILKILPYIPVPKDRRIGLIGTRISSIGETCGLVLDCSVAKEACLNDQAPTTSSTLALAMGDAMAVLYEKLVGLSKENFAKYHPGGFLGKQLSMRVESIMCTIEHCPVLLESACLRDVLLAMTSKNVGGCAIVDASNHFKGIIVEGDIRRSLTKSGHALEYPVTDIMNSKPISVEPQTLASEALQLMEKRKSQINILPVVKDGKFYGFLRIHDLLREGFQLK